MTIIMIILFSQWTTNCKVLFSGKKFTTTNNNMGYSVIEHTLGVGYSITSWLATAYNGVLYKEGGEPNKVLLINPLTPGTFCQEHVFFGRFGVFQAGDWPN